MIFLSPTTPNASTRQGTSLTRSGPKAPDREYSWLGSRLGRGSCSAQEYFHEFHSSDASSIKPRAAIAFTTNDRLSPLTASWRASTARQVGPCQTTPIFMNHDADSCNGLLFSEQRLKRKQLVKEMSLKIDDLETFNNSIHEKQVTKTKFNII